MNRARLLPIGLIFSALGLLVAGLWWGVGGKTAVFATTPPDHLPDGNFVVRVQYGSITELSQLEATGFDLWEYNNLEEQYVLVETDALGFEQLSEAGWQLVVDEQATAQLAQSFALFGSYARGGETFYGGYRTVDEVVSILNQHNADYPQLVELVDYGDAYCKESGDCTTLGGETIPDYDLLALRISNETIAGTSQILNSTIISGTKPVFFLMASIHARELSPPEVALFYIDWLLEGYGVDPQATWLVDHHEIWVIPIANPDGRWLAELGENPPYSQGPFSQRKNANRLNNTTDGSFCGVWPPSGSGQYGVDLNRNHTFEWGGAGTSSSLCSSTYRGRRAGSEPETAYLEAIVRQLIPDQRGAALTDAAPSDAKGIFITMHSYSDLVLWPWAHVGTAAPNRDGLKAIGDRLADLAGYVSCQPADCLYSASGTSDDFAYGELGVPAFTFEIGSPSDYFFPPYSIVLNEHWPENQPALRYAASIAQAPYEAAFGPVVTSATAVSGTRNITITAVFSDSDPIQAATVSLNAPAYVANAETFAMQPMDGAFDSGVETAVLSLTLEMVARLARSGGENGRYLLLLSATDVEGNHGAVEALWSERILPQDFAHFLYMPFVQRSTE